MHRQLQIHSIYRLYLVAVVFFLFYSGISAQTVIGGDTVDISAVLDIQDTARGVLLPRLTTVQRNAIMKPANGLVIFNVTENGIQINQGTPQSPNWVNLAPLPGTGNQNGNMLYWNGTSWVRLAPGLPGQGLILSQEGVPVWDGAAYPTLTTNLPVSITPTSANVSGYIIADGGANVSARGIVWGTTAKPSLSSFILNLGDGIGSFSGTLNRLSPNTLYYLRAFATNSAGTAYGNQQSFYTLPVSIPALNTSSIATITQTTAMAGGNITNDGGAAVTERGVVYGTTQNPTLVNSFTQDGSGTGNFTSMLGNLVPNTTYYVRAYATNSIGTAYGNQQSFVTQVPVIPSLTTHDVIDVTAINATGGGTITDEGGSAITARGVVWSVNPNPTLSANKTSDGTGTGTYSSTLTGFSAGITYYVRAYATNGVGTGYGNQVCFIFNPPLYSCGAYVAPGVWKQFMCHNLGAANPSADPFSPSWEINGGYWQWGRREMAAPGPDGPGADQANSGAITGWNTTEAPRGSWSESSKTDNDPCPCGYRVPTREQWEGVISNNIISNVGGSSWTTSATNYTAGKRFGDQLFLPAAGWRGDNALFIRGLTGIYWTRSGHWSVGYWYLYFNPIEAITNLTSSLLSGNSIRCIAE